MKTAFVYSVKRAEDQAGPGLGTVAQRVIHRVLDATPMPARTRTAIKQCGGCAQRAARLNRLVPDLAHPFRKRNDNPNAGTGLP